jgi:hypothetical protein
MSGSQTLTRQRAALATGAICHATASVSTAPDSQSSCQAASTLGAVQRAGEHTRIGAYRIRVAERRGRNIGTVAAVRELVELVFFALRDGTVRRLATTA